MLMGAHDGAVDEDLFEVGIIAQRLEKILPNTATAPPIEALIHGVPTAKLFRQHSPMRPRPGQPKDRFHK